MRSIGWWNVSLLAVLLALCACAPRRPVLYPNETVTRVGSAAMQRDIDDCVRRANEFISPSARAVEATQGVAGQTAIGAGSGAAIGAAGGAVTGDAGRGAAVGAATGGTAGLLHGVLGSFRSREPDPVYARFVDRCLRERGYDVIGWE